MFFKLSSISKGIPGREEEPATEGVVKGEASVVIIGLGERKLLMRKEFLFTRVITNESLG